MEYIFFLLLVLIIIWVAIFSFLQYKQNKRNKEVRNSVTSILESLEIAHIDTGEAESFNLELIKKKIYSENKELVTFLKKLYSAATQGKIDNRFVNIKELDEDTLEYGLIRMSALDNGYDSSKFLPQAITLLTFFVTGYISFFTDYIYSDSPFYQSVFPFVVTILVYLIVSNLIGENRRDHSAITYFRELLKFAIRAKKKNNCDDSAP